MDAEKNHELKNVNVLLLWRRGEASSYLENVTATIYESGIVQVKNPADKEKITTHISNLVIV